MATLIDSSRPNITVTNTATETTVYTVTIPGGTIGTGGLVYAVLLGKKVKNGGGADSAMIMRVYLDSTLVGTLEVNTVSADSANGRTLKLEVEICGNGATNAQATHSRLIGGTNTDQFGLMADYTETTKDSTGDLDLEVTWQQAAVPEHSYTSQHGVVMVV